MDKNQGLIVGVGSALMDILAHENDAFLNQAGATKGGMTYVADTMIDCLATRLLKRPDLVPGGSACNTVVGVANLGGAGKFVGKCGRDDLGDLFVEGLEKNGVKPGVLRSDEPTGRVLSIITPDAQRSMLTFLGASSLMTPDDVGLKIFEGAAVALIEGYLLFNRELITVAVKNAKKAGAMVCLDLASFTVVEQAKDFLDDLVKAHVDILIANEDEARAFTGLEDEEAALEKMAEKAEIGVLKVGERGSYISRNGHVTRVPAKAGCKTKDTTGAGDLWASGFLFGLVNGFSMEKCGELASACGFEVCQVNGACIPSNCWDCIKKIINNSSEE